MAEISEIKKLFLDKVFTHRLNIFEEKCILDKKKDTL